MRECQDFALKNDFIVVGEYIDRAISGKTDNRADFQRMIKDSEKGLFEAVIMYTLDRFARNRYDSAMYKAKLKKNGVKVYYAKQNIPDSPEGIILESVLEGYAEYYSENLSRNIKRGMKENALQCKFNGSGLALGYRVGEDGRYEIDPAGAAVVRSVYEMYANSKSATQIIASLNESGYRTVRGNAFTKNSLRTILQNRKYIGVYSFDEVEIEGGVPAIVDRELFDKVQETLERNHKARARCKAKADYLLSTKLFCGHCGSNMVGESGTGKYGGLYHYYKCNDRKLKKSCPKQTEKKDWIEEAVVRATVENVLTPENIEAIATKAVAILEKEAADNSVLLSLQKKLKETERSLKNLVKMMEQGIFSETTKERLMELESYKSDLKQLIGKEEMKKPFLSKERIMHWLSTFKNGDINDIEYRRRIIDTLVNAVFVYDTDGGKGREIVCTFNISGHNTATIKCSDIACFAPPKGANPNSFFFVKNVFGFVIKIPSMD